MPATRRRAVAAVAAALACGRLVIDPGADRADTVARLLTLPGVGPWTAGYIALRGLGDPDVFLPTDAGVRHALARLGQRTDPAAAATLAESWRPWRSYALLHMWGMLSGKETP